MNDQQILTEFYQQLRPDLDVRANDRFLIEQSTKPVTVGSLYVSAAQLSAKLVLHPAYESAWQEFVFYNPDRKNLAERNLFLEQMRQKEIQSASRHEYNSLIRELDREDLRGIPLQDLRELAATQRENNRRKSLSGPQLHELSKKENPLPQRGELPTSWFGADISTPQALRSLAKKNVASFKALCERFGTREVNKFLGVKPTVQPGYAKSLKI